ncbi:MAG TPA: DUF4288 domain-containing protein [Bryobacteraceae bacterium]|nr:DUF4288 domain-containing protein [Bryobacteraceae bacterium]
MLPSSGATVVEHWVLDGVAELVEVHEQPVSGSELLWIEEEVGYQEIARRIQPKEHLSVFGGPRQKTSDWYVAKIVLEEIHDCGAHGDSVLLWTNWDLINAASPEAAFDRAMELGREQQSPPGSHRCDGDTAHWEFKGLNDLVRIDGPPRDGGILWFEEFAVHRDGLARLLPPRADLGVFSWEERHRGRDKPAGGGK